MKENQLNSTMSSVKTASEQASGRTAGVEAIFLSPADPEEGSSGTSKELWRPAQEKSDASGSETKGPVQSHKSPSSGVKEVKSSDKSADQKPKEHGDQVSNKHSGKTPVASAEKSSSSGKPSKLQSHQEPLVAGQSDVRPPSDGRIPLRKSRSVTDIDGERESQVSSTPSTARGRRMSISVAHYSMASSSHDSSRRSSAASIVISVSRPDSPVPHLIQRPTELPNFEEYSLEFLRLRRTVSAVTMITKFKHMPGSNMLSPETPRLTTEETAENLIRMHRERRNSMPAIPRLNLKGEAESPPNDENRNQDKSKNKRLSGQGQQSRRRGRRRRSSTGSSIIGFYMPASRPSSAMAAAAALEMSRRSSSATIVQLGKLSRPWTPARSPSPVSLESGGNRWTSGSRGFFRNRTPASMAVPLQALNQKVNNILGCASNILDFYHLRPDLKKEQNPQREARLSKSKKMNEKKKAEETSQMRLIKFRKKAGNNLLQNELMREANAATSVGKGTPLQIIKLQQIGKQNQFLDEQKESRINATKKNEDKTKIKIVSPKVPVKILKTKISNLSVPTQGSSTSSASSTKSKGIALLKSMMNNNRTSAAAASAFTGKSLPLPAKAKMNKVLKMGKQFRPRYSKNKSSQQAAQNANINQGPPTLVNFFKRSNRTNPENRAPIKYETFTDKDRAAAVLLGDADIKTTLEKQLKSERGRYVLPKESPAQVYLAQADFEMRIGGLATAKILLNKALELQPGDKNALCSRSRCRLQMGDAKGALEDAEEALNSDSTYVKATYQKAEVLYQMGRFEEALVFYHKGCKQRPDMDLFNQGVRKAQEAIEVSLGVKQPTLQQQQQHRTTILHSKKKSWGEGSSIGPSRLPPLNLNNGHQQQQPQQQRRWSRGSGPTSHRESSLLGDLHVDKIYLERLLQNPGLHNQSVPSQKIIHHAKETLEYLKARENFWRQQQPSHIIYPKEKIKYRTHRRRIPSSQTNFTSTEDSATTDRDQQTESESSTSRLVEDSSSETLTERATTPPVETRCSSEEISRILASTVYAKDNCQDVIEEWRDVVNDMTECNEKQQLNRCIHVFLTKCWRGPTVETEELTAEIEDKMSLLRLHEEQEKECGGLEENITAKMHLAIQIAILYLANGQQELSTTSAQQGLALAESTSDMPALLQLWLLMAALEAMAGNSTNVKTCLSHAHHILDHPTEALQLPTSSPTDQALEDSNPTSRSIKEPEEE